MLGEFSRCLRGVDCYVSYFKAGPWTSDLSSESESTRPSFLFLSLNIPFIRSLLFEGRQCVLACHSI
ncbi:Uncharacterized protein APZ42_023002 [Daphnia magna]|uniref:Uncharacterized protein n=1 Tax=Daphnia magna TaxID=35525 RepID=A0A0P6AMM3_9CRUS|nr:Uncharacterized protein APZ42_023002 [Daphnia magna]